jgi:putative ABC transport system permease protein
MEALLRDLRFALRSLARAPGYSAVVVAILAVAIGATTAIYSVVDAVLLRPLPFRDPERLVLLWEKEPAFAEMSVAYPNFVDWRDQARSFEGIAAFRTESFNLGGVDRPERVEGLRASAGFFRILGITPVLGREFTPDEDRTGGAPVALVTDELWRSRFGASGTIVGRRIVLEGVPHTVVGVLPPGFRFGRPLYSVVVPTGQIDPKQIDRGDHPGLFGVARLRPGVTLAQARSEMESIGRAIAERYKDAKDTLPVVAPMHEQVVRDIRAKLVLLMAAAAFVLLIAVANVANLSLARGVTRRRELAIRAALGSGRGRLVRQLLVENAVVALAGGALGVLLATWGVDLLLAYRPTALPRIIAIGVDGRVLAFALAASLAAGILSGLAPALTLSDARLHDVLRAGDLGGGGGAHLGRMRTALVVVEVALACALLAGAGLSARAFARLAATDPGFRTQDVLTFEVSAPAAKYPTTERLRAVERELLRAISATPGVRSASLSLGLPLAGSSETSFHVKGEPEPSGADMNFAVYMPVTPGFFETLGIPLREGRVLDERDRAGAPLAVVVDEVLARRFFPNGDAIGKWLSNTGGTHFRQIVGIVPHVKMYGLAGKEPAPYQMYWAMEQIPEEYMSAYARQVMVAVRTAGAPLASLEAVRRAVAGVDPELPLHDVRAYGERLRESVAAERFSTALLALFAAVAVLLAVGGVYAVMSHAVTRRTHEIGVRMALGAQPGAVQRMVVGQGLRIVAVGLAVGLAATLLLARTMAHLVEGAGRLDPAALGAAVALLCAVALAATWIPARRATRVDPVIALREE